MTTHRITLRKALEDPQLLGAELQGKSWKPWKVLLLASLGEKLTADEREIFKAFTNRECEPGQRAEETCVVKGRRAGGSSATGKVLIPYLAGLTDYPMLTRGERGVLLCVAADQRQADVILDYAEAAFRKSPLLGRLIKSRTARELRLTNHITVEVRAADFKRLRGLTFIGCIADEMAFWETSEQSANPDTEILDAIRPGLATTGGPLFLISSPYARKGELWRIYNKHFGPQGDPLILVAKGTSREFNSTLPQSIVDRALEKDFASASAEYLGDFRKDIEGFVILEVVMGCVATGIYERAPDPSISYSAFVDPSGGSADSMSLCIGHGDYSKQTVIIDLIREVPPPFSPEAVCEDFARTLKNYRITSVIGDRYAGIWPVEQFAKFNIRYEQSAQPKSDLYRDLLPLINSGRIELLDHPKLINQLCNLERRTARGGRDSIDHPPGQHDDIANCVAGLAAINNKFGGFDTAFPFGNRDDYEASVATKQQQQPERVQTNGGSQRCPTYQEQLQWKAEDEARKRADAEENAAFNAQMLFRRASWGH